MFSSTLKQSVATLGVVAGLLAAAGPASAQILDGPILAKAGPQPEAGDYLATDPSSEADNHRDGGRHRQGTTRGTQVGNEGVKDDVPLETVSFTIMRAAFRGEVIGLEPTVKAPANAMSTGVSGQRCGCREGTGDPVSIRIIAGGEIVVSAPSSKRIVTRLILRAILDLLRNVARGRRSSPVCATPVAIAGCARRGVRRLAHAP